MSSEELLHVIQVHLQDMCTLYGERIGVLMFRKHLARYLHDWLITPEIRRSLFSHSEAAPLVAEIKHLLQLV